jgi:hypothetical protein
VRKLLDEDRMMLGYSRDGGGSFVAAPTFFVNGRKLQPAAIRGKDVRAAIDAAPGGVR